MKRQGMPRHLVSMLALVIVVTSCTSSDYLNLKSAREMEGQRDLEARFDGMPMTPRPVETVDDAGRVYDVVVHQWQPKRDADRILIFIHGVLSDHGSWRYLAGLMGGNNSLCLIDLPGCGDSDAPSPGIVGEDLYSIDSMADRVLQAISACIEDVPGSPPVALVGHSLGGSVVLRMFSERFKTRFAAVHDRIDRVVLLSPFDIAIPKPDPTFQEVVDTTGLKVTFADLLGLLQGIVARISAKSFDDPRRVPREEADRLHAILRNMWHRNASRAMLKQAVPWTKDLRPDWKRVEAITAEYANLKVPCLILWGARDETLPLSMGYKLWAELPQATLRVLLKSKHSLQLERPHVCKRLIKKFIVQEHMAQDVALVDPMSPVPATAGSH